jgi:PhnB protein
MRFCLSLLPAFMLIAAAPAAEEPAKEAADAMSPPAGLHSVTPYLCVRDVKEALDFYTKAFAAKTVMNIPGKNGKIFHAEIQIGDSLVMIGEPDPDVGSKETANVNHLYVSNVDAVFKQAVGAGAKEISPVKDMPWGHRFAVIIDPYGQVWSMATPKAAQVDSVAPAAKKEM